MSAASILALWLSLMPASQAGPFPDTAARLLLEPGEVPIDLLYRGAVVRISGTAPLGSGLAVVCASEPQPLELQEKGKIGGMLWMNVADVSFADLPFYYQVITSGKLADMAQSQILDENGIGYRSLEARVARGAASAQERLFPELIKLKEGEGLYGISEGGMSIGPASGNTVSFSAVFAVPAKAPEGLYSLRLIGFQGGRGRLMAEATLPVRLVGAAAAIKAMSETHGLLYGICSVVIALAAGLATGLIFGRGGKGSH